MLIRWPFDNIFRSESLSPARLEATLQELSEAAIAATHKTERDELVDIITGQPTGYVHHTEIFVVDDRDAPRARQILEQMLDTGRSV